MPMSISLYECGDGDVYDIFLFIRRSAILSNGKKKMEQKAHSIKSYKERKREREKERGRDHKRSVYLMIGDD